MRIMSMVDGQLGSNTSQITLVANALLSSSDVSVQQMGATYVLKNDPSKVDLKDLVREAAKSHSYSTARKRAIEAINIAQRDLTDEKIIIDRLADSSQSVREIAVALANGFTLTNAHLDSLVEMQESSYSTSRKAAAVLVSKIDSPEANEKLVENMSDSSQSVREEINSQLSAKTLKQDDIPNLERQMDSSSYSTVRKNAATLIGSVSGDSASKALIESMSDNSQSVREEVYSQLASRNISAVLISELAQQMGSSYSTVRKNVAVLLGKQGKKAASVLIDNMSDSSQSVREEIYSQLSALNLGKVNVEKISTQLSNSSYSTVRKNAATLLGDIADSSATTVLVKSMSDSSQSVREEIVTQLDKMVLADSNVDDLGAQFASSYSTVRKEVARLLGKIKTEKSLDALVAQLQVENSQSVKDQIAASIAAIRG